MSNPATQRQFTGWHMLTIIVVFFATIIAVNITMAVFANTSWTGLVVQNSYVASQHFNEKLATARAQAALGWTTQLEIADGAVSYALVDASGKAVDAAKGVAIFRRPVAEGEDRQVQLAAGTDGLLRVSQDLHDGAWTVEILV